MLIVHSTLTSKAQTTIPSEVRDALSLRVGDRINYFIDGARVMLRVKNKRAVDLAGLLYDPDRLAVGVEDIETSIADAIADDVAASR
jgi:bifunctional DNA-binding transcriptional regulator/antitoxin component of YhaV-PrlF toxin-antitoxin module